MHALRISLQWEIANEDCPGLKPLQQSPAEVIRSITLAPYQEVGNSPPPQTCVVGREGR